MSNSPKSETSTLSDNNKNNKTQSELSKRIIWGLVLGCVALSATYIGGVIFASLITIIGILFSREWCNITCKKSDYHNDNHYILLFYTSIVSIIIISLNAAFIPELDVYYLLVVGIMLIINIFATVTQKWKKWISLGLIYSALPVYSLIMIRNSEEYGLYAIIWLFIIIWATDSGAYFVGKKIGGKKLAPKISPGKTWAGFFGGLFFGTMSSMFMLIIIEQSWVAGLILGAIIAIIGQLGDLLESYIKRIHNVKDSGNLIPGHGGIMDRMDSIVVVSIFAFYLGYVRNSEEIAKGLLVW